MTHTDLTLVLGGNVNNGRPVTRRLRGPDRADLALRGGAGAAGDNGALAPADRRTVATTGGVAEVLRRPRRDFAEFVATARGSR